jgi:hypothetical protein
MPSHHNSHGQSSTGTLAMLEGLAQIHKEHFVQNKTFSVVKSEHVFFEVWM